MRMLDASLRQHCWGGGKQRSSPHVQEDRVEFSPGTKSFREDTRIFTDARQKRTACVEPRLKRGLGATPRNSREAGSKILDDQVQKYEAS